MHRAWWDSLDNVGAWSTEGQRQLIFILQIFFGDSDGRRRCEPRAPAGWSGTGLGGICAIAGASGTSSFAPSNYSAGCGKHGGGTTVRTLAAFEPGGSWTSVPRDGVRKPRVCRR